MGLYLARHEEDGSTVTMLGTITSSEVNRIGAKFFSNDRFKQMGYSIWDLTEADFPDFMPGQNPVIYRAAVEAAVENPRHKVGLVASKSSVQELCEDLVGLNIVRILPWNLRVFASMDEAIGWIGKAS